MKNANPKPKPYRGLEAIQEMVAAPVEVQFQVNGHDCEIVARLLTPAETEVLKLILDEAMPPIIRGKTEADDRIDFANPDYLRKKGERERLARALAVFWTCKDFQDAFRKEHGKDFDMMAPGQRGNILVFVQKMLVDDALDIIYKTVANPAISVKDLVNLPSPGGA